jgi:hypothetical protein
MVLMFMFGVGDHCLGDHNRNPERPGDKSTEDKCKPGGRGATKRLQAVSAPERRNESPLTSETATTVRVTRSAGEGAKSTEKGAN